MITFTTEFSTYELDQENKRVRRIAGTNDPTQYQGPDGVWKEYTSFMPDPIQLNVRVEITWAEGKYTVTSRVKEIS